MKFVLNKLTREIRAGFEILNIKPAASLYSLLKHFLASPYIVEPQHEVSIINVDRYKISEIPGSVLDLLMANLFVET